MQRQNTNASSVADLLGTSIVLNIAGQPFEVSEMTVRQTLQLLGHRQAIASLNFDDLPTLLEKQQDLVLELASIMLGVAKDVLLNAKNSEVMAAIQAAIALNKTFFLQAVQSVVGAMQVKSAIQSQLASLQTSATGPAPSASSLPQATASAMSTPTAPLSSTPTAPPSTT